MASRGAITWLGMALTCALLAGVYLAWVWIPVYVEQYVVEQTIRQVASEAERSPDDARLLAQMVARIRAVRTVDDVGPDGRLVRRPLVDVEPKDVALLRAGQDALRVVFEYRRDLVYPLIDRRLERWTTVDLTVAATPRRGAQPGQP